jgi:hypothetical protein
MELYGRPVNFKLGRDRLEYAIYYCVQYQIDSIRRGESTNRGSFPISFAFDGITMKDHISFPGSTIFPPMERLALLTV